jgi:hypothetical protein
VPAKREDISEEGVAKLASYGCTQEEIADFFDTSRSVITARFGQAFKLGSSTVRKNVRMWQMRRALKGSDTMLIHLGKHYCDQRDKPSQEPEAKETPATDEHGNSLEP